MIKTTEELKSLAGDGRKKRGVSDRKGRKRKRTIKERRAKDRDRDR